jgi:collagenase-like PrtC family protease
MREFTVASNWEKELIDGLVKYPEVKSVFAKLSSDIIGGGRASFNIPKVSRKQAEEYIRYVHSKGIKFDYLFNACCLGNIEFTKRGKERIIKELDWAVYEAKIDSIVVSTNYLFKLVKKRYPKIKVGVGLWMRVYDLNQFKYYDDAGAGWITLPYGFTKFYKLLVKLRKIIQCELHILVNDMDVYWCPYSFYHTNALSHMSRKNNFSRELWIDPCLWNCTKIKLENPEELFKSDYIRPEDLNIYENMGYRHFKIVGRSRPTQWLLRSVKAYVDRKYDGNILDIFNLGMSMGKEEVCENVSKNFYKYFLKNYSSDKVWLKIYFGRYKKGLPSINNKDLEGVAEQFCKHRCDLINCSECGYCKKVAQRLAKFKNPEIRKELIEILQASIDAFLSNKLFRPQEKQKGV